MIKLEPIASRIIFKIEFKTVRALPQKSAKKDIEKCMEVANLIGIKQTSGTKEYPIFEK